MYPVKHLIARMCFKSLQLNNYKILLKMGEKLWSYISQRFKIVLSTRKWWLASLITREMQIKITLRHYFTSIEMTSTMQRKQEQWQITNEETKLRQQLRKAVAQFLNLNMGNWRRICVNIIKIRCIHAWNCPRINKTIVLKIR